MAIYRPIKYSCAAILAWMMCFVGSVSNAYSQELNAKVSINHSQVQGTNTSIYDNLEKALTSFLNETKWTSLHFQTIEKIKCSLAITITAHSETDHSFKGSILVQSSRPIYNSGYTSTLYSIKDADFNFDYQEQDQLEFRMEQMDNNLTAMLAYYAYLIIGMDMDSMQKLGGTDVLNKAMEIANNAQSSGATGWKAFDDSHNRFAIINDYLDSGLEDLRTFNYEYYRNGLDIMADSVEVGRKNITTTIALLESAHKNKSQSSLPQIFTDFKKDEFVNIYRGKGTKEEKDKVFNILFGLNASQRPSWDEIKK